MQSSPPLTPPLPTVHRGPGLKGLYNFVLHTVRAKRFPQAVFLQPCFYYTWYFQSGPSLWYRLRGCVFYWCVFRMFSKEWLFYRENMLFQFEKIMCRCFIDRFDELWKCIVFQLDANFAHDVCIHQWWRILPTLHKNTFWVSSNKHFYCTRFPPLKFIKICMIRILI